jgi:hypothetical protein
MMNDAQRVAIQACRTLRICLSQEGDYGSSIDFECEGDDDVHRGIVYYLPFVRRLVVIRDERSQVREFGLECGYPMDHFFGSGVNPFMLAASQDELVEALSLLASEYGIRFEQLISVKK